MSTFFCPDIIDVLSLKVYSVVGWNTLKVLLTLKRCSKKPILTYLAKITESSISLALKSLIEVRIISCKSNTHKMRGPKSHVVYNPKKNFQELQLHQTLVFLSQSWHMSRS